MSVTKEQSTLNTVKIWIFPGLVSIISFFIFDAVNQINKDVRLLLVQSGVTMSQLQNHENRISRMENSFFKTENIRYIDTFSQAKSKTLVHRPDSLFKHEEELDVKKYLK